MSTFPLDPPADVRAGLPRGLILDSEDDVESGPWWGAAGVAAMLLAVLGTVLLTPEEPIDLPASNTCQVDVSRSTGRTGPTCTTRSEQLVVDDR